MDTINQIIKGDFDLDFVGKNLDNLNGTISGKNIEISRNNNLIQIPNLQISAVENQSIKSITLKSEPLDLEIKGDFKLSKLNVSLQDFAYQLLPAYMPQIKEQLPKEELTFSINVKNPNQLTALYLPELSLSPFKMSAFYNSDNKELKLFSDNKSIKYNEIEILNSSFSAIKEKDSVLTIKFNAKNITNYKDYNVEQVDIKAFAFKNIIDFRLIASDTTYKLKMDSKGHFLFKNDSVFLTMKSSDLLINKEEWKIKDNSKILFTSQKINLDQLTLFNQNQSITLNGEYGEKAQEDLVFDVDNFDLKLLNNFIKSNSFPKTFGVSNGKIKYNTKNQTPSFSSDFEINHFQLGKDTLGNFSVKTENNGLKAPQKIKIQVLDGLLDSLEVSGEIDYLSKSNNLNLSAFLPKTKASVFEPLLKGIMTNFKGFVYTRDSLKISGTFAQPEVSGQIVFEDIELLIDYLKVPVKFSAVVNSQKNMFKFSPFEIFDDKNNKAKASGNITHNGFKDYKLNFYLKDVDNFHVLNTQASDNNLYYGQGFMSGSAQFNGPFENLDIKINAKTMPNTVFFLPISEGVASDLPSFVHFKLPKKKFVKKTDEFPLNSLILDIEANNNATVEIIFDETLGDKITGTGNGNLKMEMNNNGDFYMFGNYKVSSGKYLFTAFDLYNKPFYIRPGGTITWYGDPFDAKLDIVAYNTARSSSQPLQLAVSLNSNGSTTSRLITVESELYLKGNLFTPEISFGLNFPKLQYEVQEDYITLQSVISRIKTDKDEVSRQVFGLLIMNSFLPPTFAESSLGVSNVGSTALSTAGSDLLSAQLSNWLNKIDPNWRVNVIYKNGTLTLPPEYGVELSSKFLKDKLSIDGSYSTLTNRPNINLEYKITKKGNIKVKAYTRSSFNSINTTSLSTPITTTGVGIVYTKEFNKLSWFRRKKKKVKAVIPQ